MRYVILGAGAIGGSIGGLLSLYGLEVALLARGEHARVMQASGLTLARPDATHQLKLEVAAVPAELRLRGDDVLIATTKTQHTAELLDEIARQPVAGGVAADALPVVCAQNGVENERLALRRFRRVYGICVMLPATHIEPGHVEAQGGPYPGMLDIGCYPHGVDAIAEQTALDLSASGFLSIARAEIMRWKYAKLIRNLGNAIEALCGHDDTVSPLVRELVGLATAEGREALAAAGVDVVGDDEWRAYRMDQVQIRPIFGQERGGGSSWQSATRGSDSIEADYLNGEIGLLGRLHDVSTPVNDLLQSEANALVRDHRPPGSVSPAMLLARL